MKRRPAGVIDKHTVRSSLVLQLPTGALPHDRLSQRRSSAHEASRHGRPGRDRGRLRKLRLDQPRLDATGGTRAPSRPRSGRR